MQLTDILEVIKDLGLTGGLIVGIWAFITGKIWPKEMVEKAIEAQKEASETTAKIIVDEICVKIGDEVANGMDRGIARGYLKINREVQGE